MTTQNKWNLVNRIERSNRAIYNLGANGVFAFRQIAGRDGARLHLQGWRILGEIRAEIQPNVLALRERQEVLESIGTRVNGGF